MYNSQYYTCEQIDERLLQGYLDDYNTQTGQSLTKAQFLTKLRNAIDNFVNEGEVKDLIESYVFHGDMYGGLATPSGTPQLPEEDQAPLFFIAISPGTYTNYGNITISKPGFHIILWDTDTWSVQQNILEIEQVLGESTVKLLSQKAITDFLSLTTDSNVKAQLGYYECDTAAGTAAKAITVANYALFAGGSMKVKFANKNTANNATLNINSQGAKALYYQGERASATNSWDAEEVVEIYYDGTSYYANNVKGGSGSGVYDVSKEHPTSGPNSDGKFTLEYILNSSNVNELIPVKKRYPGMTIKFVSTSDNKYVSYRLTKDEWSIDTEDWAIADEGVYVDNPEFIYVKTDKNDKILWAIKTDGSIYYGAGVPQQVIDYIDEKIAELSLDEYENIVAFLNGLEEGDKTLQQLLNDKVDKEEGKSLIDSEYASTKYTIDNPEYLEVTTDAEDKILEAITESGVKQINCPIENSASIVFTEKNKEWTDVIIDEKGGIIAGIKPNGSVFISHLDENSNTVIVAEDGTGDFIKICDAIEYSNKYKNLRILVKAGTYDLIKELGANYFSSMPNTYYQGLKIGNGTSIIGIGNDVNIVAQYTGDNVYVGHQFSIFNIIGSCTVENINFIGQNIRYIIHDDVPTSSYPELKNYIVAFRNCKFNHKGSTMYNPQMSTPVAVGGGCKNHSIHIWENCCFESEGLLTNFRDDLSYHNYEGCDSKVVIKDNFFSDDNVARVRVMNNSSGQIEVFAFNNRTTKANEFDDSPLITVREYNGGSQSAVVTDKVSVANGNLKAFGTYQSELDASPVENNADIAFVASHNVVKRIKNNFSRGIVGINNDDLQPSDYIANRKIYNKYGYNADFNFILRPFTSIADIEVAKQNIKALIKDGNTIGLHAILGASYWLYNRIFDVRPDGGYTFAPKLSDVKGPEADGTGMNGFGNTITVDTTISQIGYGNLPSELHTLKVVELTQEQLNSINIFYTHYANTNTFRGLDFNNNLVAKRYIQWLEYWYNELIDDTLGYSSTESSIADRFAEDYEVPSGASASDYYPDASHLRNGKIVFYDDTTNPHYNDSDFQKVGRFKKGLFKGCASCCNYEVIDRCLDIAIAFVRYYFDLNNFSHHSRHGGYDAQLTCNYNGVLYYDTNHYFTANPNGKVFRSRDMSFVKVIDIFTSRGIKFFELKPNSCVGEQYLCNKGAISKRGIVGKSNQTNFLDLFGNQATVEAISYSDFATFMEGIDNWLLFFYENAGKTITRNGITFPINVALRNGIMEINSAIGTGYIPILNYDTIIVDPSISTSLDLLLRYCYSNQINVVPTAVACDKANSYKDVVIKDNYFPNPTFNQSVVNTLGNVRLALPDGWNFIWEVGEPVVTVDQNDNSLAVSSAVGEYIEISTRAYMLPAGDYTLSLMVKGTGNISVYNMKNKSSANLDVADRVGNFTGGSDYEERTVTFHVDEYKVKHDNTDMNQILGGYEDNFAYLQVKILCMEGNDIAIKDCSIKRINL